MHNAVLDSYMLEHNNPKEPGVLLISMKSCYNSTLV